MDATVSRMKSNVLTSKVSFVTEHLDLGLADDRNEDRTKEVIMDESNQYEGDVEAVVEEKPKASEGQQPKSPAKAKFEKNDHKWVDEDG